MSVCSPISDGTPDLYAIQKHTRSTGTTEVHILRGAGDSQRRLLRTRTILPATGTHSGWAFLVGDTAPR